MDYNGLYITYINIYINQTMYYRWLYQRTPKLYPHIKEKQETAGQFEALECLGAWNSSHIHINGILPRWVIPRPVLLHSWRQRARCGVACFPTKRFGPWPPPDSWAMLETYSAIALHTSTFKFATPPKKLPVCLKHSWTDCVFFKTTHPKTPMGPPPLGPAQWPDHSWSRGWRPRPEERPETKDCAWSQQENTNKTAWWLLLPPLKNDGVSNSWDYDIPNIWKNTIHVPNHQPVMDAGRFHQMEDPTWSKPTESFFSVEV